MKKMGNIKTLTTGERPEAFLDGREYSGEPAGCQGKMAWKL
jgi:hypothetical protein